MKYDVQVIRGICEKGRNFKFIVRGSRMKYLDYGSVFSYALDESGSIKTFDDEGAAWAYASKLSRGLTPSNVEVRGCALLRSPSRLPG